jgi:signal transduction histidine kinase
VVLRWRHSLAGRISALVLLVVVVTGTAALVILGQLRELQQGFDRLTEVYVVFNQKLAEAHVQSVRIGEQVRTHQLQAQRAPGPEVVPPPDAAFSANFVVGLAQRRARIAEARAPVDDALADPARFGGADQLEELRELQESLVDLESLSALDEMVDPADVLVDILTQRQIEQSFESLAKRSNQAIATLRQQLRETRAETERLTLGLTAAVAVIGVLATLGVVVTLRPLRRLTDAVRNLGQGDWSQKIAIPAGRDDEVRQLSAEFNAMADALQERERRLLRGERLAAAGQLAAQITHEIRNPLSSVGLNAELLEDELASASPEARELLHKISREVDRLTAVTEDYLRFARRSKPDFARVDLRAELVSLLDFMGQELQLAGVKVDVDLPAEPVMVDADGNQLRQVFMNLVRNAQEAVIGEEPADPDDRPRIGVMMRCKDGTVSVVVSDNGPGIELPDDELDRIFEAFYTRKAKGTGLGLPMVQQILADHAGGVRVAETGPQGTRFEVSLPACATPAPSVSSQRDGRATGDVSPSED